MGIQIHQLPERPSGPAGYCNVAIDDGENTYRADIETMSATYDAQGVAFTNSDTTLTPSATLNVPLLANGDTKKSLFGKLSQVVRNVRWLVNLMGSIDISSIGGGTVTGAIAELATKNMSWIGALLYSGDLTPATIAEGDWWLEHSIFVARVLTSGSGSLGGVAVGIRYTSTNVRWMALTTNSSTNRAYVSYVGWTLDSTGRIITNWTIRGDSSGATNSPVEGFSHIYGVM